MSIRAMVMAAGAGTRLQPLTYDVPKPMVPVCNRPVLEYTIENLRAHGIHEMVFNLHSHPEQVRQHFGDGTAFGVSIQYSSEPVLMGTAGGVKKVESFLKGNTFLVMSGDGLTRVNLTALLQFHQHRSSMATMGLKAVDSRFEYGVTITNATGRIQRFIEKPLWSDVFSNQVNTGIYAFEPSVLKKIPARKNYDFGNQVWPKLLSAKAPIYGFEVQSYWCDVGNLIEYRRAQRDMLDNKVGFSLPGRQIKPGVWVDQGARIAAGVKLSAPCVIGRDVRIDRGAKIGAYTVIGHRSRIGARAQLSHCTLWNGVEVDGRVRLAHCIIGHKARVKENISVFEGAVINLSR